MTLFSSAYPLCQIMVMMRMLLSDGLGLLHIQCLEKCCSHLPREGCAFSPNQFAFTKVKTPTASQPGSTHRLMLAKLYSREAHRLGEKGGGATETVNSHRVWEELHSQNE